MPQFSGLQLYIVITEQRCIESAQEKAENFFKAGLKKDLIKKVYQ